MANSCETPSQKERAVSPSETCNFDPEDKSLGYSASTLTKCLVVFITSFMALTTCFSSTSLFSAASYVAADYGTSVNTINISSAGLLVAMGLSNFVWGPLIPLIGRMNAYNGCIILLLVWTVAASVAPNLASFITFRVLSGFQGTFFHVTGQAILAEYFPPVKRGTATGFFLCGTVLGPPLAPLTAGIITTYTTWRVILYVQSGMIAFGLCLSLLFLPKEQCPIAWRKTSFRKVVRQYNPLQVIGLMRYPNLLLTDIASGFLSWCQYSLLSSPHHILVTKYGITSPLIAGLFYLSPAGGFLLGTLVGGHFSDITVRKWISRRAGVRLPQDRLRSGFLFWFVVIPAASLVFGWSVEKQFGGLALPIVSAFFSAAGILAAFAGLNTYCAEVMPLKRQEAIASKYLLQYCCSALASATVIPLIDVVGIGIQCSISVGLVYTAGLLCASVALYGINMKNWTDRIWPVAVGEIKSTQVSYNEPSLYRTLSAP